MHRFAHGVVPAKRKRNVTYSAANSCPRQIFFDPARRFKEIDRVIAMFFQAGGNRQNVWIEDNVVCRKVCLCRQKLVSPRSDVDFALGIIRLAVLIECHDDRSRAVSPDQSRVTKKLFFAVFQADGVHHCFSLHAFESRFDDAPL